jgi:hypothetical protein
MKNLIRKILKEDFDWAKDVPSYDDMKIEWETHVLPYLTGMMPTYDEDGDIQDYEYWTEISQEKKEDLEPLVKHYYIRLMDDMEYKDGKFLMSVSQWGEFVPMFKDCSYQGYICRYTAESVLDEEDHWEPYHDVVQDWMDEVWESVDEQSYKLIVDHMRKYYIGDDIKIDGKETQITDEMFDSWIGDSDVLGGMIADGYNSGGLEDVENSLKWWYEDAYNTATRDEYWTSTHEAIKGVVGNGEWESYEVRKMGGVATRHQLVFDVSDIFMEVIQTYFDDYCDLSYDHDCDLEYSDFLDNLIFMMDEELYGELLNPRVSEWPDSDKVKEYFNERIREELG